LPFTLLYRLYASAFRLPRIALARCGLPSATLFKGVVYGEGGWFTGGGLAVTATDSPLPALPLFINAFWVQSISRHRGRAFRHRFICITVSQACAEKTEGQLSETLPIAISWRRAATHYRVAFWRICLWHGAWRAGNKRWTGCRYAYGVVEMENGRTRRLPFAWWR